MKDPTLVRRRKSPAPTLSASPGEWLTPLMFSVAALALAVAVLAIYSPSLDFQFILDDHHFVSDPRLQSAGHVWEYFTHYVWVQVAGAPPSFYRPIFVLWLRLNFILSGMSPWGWHLLSVIKHLSVTILLGLLVWKLLRDRIATFLACAFFALHPAHTESVAWVTVPDPLMSAGLLGSLLLYIKYMQRSSTEDPTTEDQTVDKKSKKRAVKPSGTPTTHPVAWLVASLLVYLLALMAKETAIVLPAALIFVALFVPFSQADHRNSPAEKTADDKVRAVSIVQSALREVVPFLIVTALYFFARWNALGRITSDTQHLPWRTVLLSWPAILWFYLETLLWPIRSHAFGDPTLADVWSTRGVLLPGMAVVVAAAALATGCAWAWKKTLRDTSDPLASTDSAVVKRTIVLGVSILVLPILLTLNINALNPGDFLHGRYTYLPLAGLSILIAAGWHVAKRQAVSFRIVFLAAAASVTVAFGVLTLQQENMWANDLTVFTVGHEIAPHNIPVDQALVRAHVQSALALIDTGRCDQAVPIFEQAIQQYPQDWFAWGGLGECRFNLADLPGAEQALRRAYELSHEPRVKEEWEQVRARMGLSSAPLS
jgi:hypothetical protein